MKHIFAGVAATSIICMAAGTADAQQLHDLDLPAGQLRRAVIALGKQANISIAIADSGLARIPVRRVRGTMTVEVALRRMLDGTSASFVSLGRGDYRIVRAAIRAPSSPRTREEADAPPPFPGPEAPTEDIIVTGSKRRLRLRDYPGPATVLGGDAFDAGSASAGTGAISDRLPSLGSTHLGPGRDKLFIRGIADSSFIGQTQATVGQYLGEARLNYNAPDPDLRLYDIASVELLPGPQGTLYGAGSMGGVLRVIPNAPDLTQTSAALTGSVALTLHGEMSGELAAMVNLPVSGRGGVRMVAYNVRDGGYIDDIQRRQEDTNRTRISGGRFATLWELDGSWAIEAGALIQSIKGDDGQYSERPDGELARSSYFAQPFSNDYRLAYATVRGELGAHSLTSTVSASDQDLMDHFEFREEEPGLLRQHNRLSLMSTETRLARTREDGTGWIVGMSLVRNRTHLTRKTGEPGDWTRVSGIRNRLDEQTLFGEMSRRVAGTLMFTAGARATHYRFSGESEVAAGSPGASTQSAGDSQWHLLPSLGASIEIGRAALAYLRYQQSFRPGGVILRSAATQLIESDRIAAWEAGIRYGRGPVRGSLAYSHARWKDVQADLLDTIGESATINVGDGTIRSIEASLDWKVVQGLTTRAAGTLNRSRLSSERPGIIPIDDNPLPNVPRVVARGEIEYSRPIGSAGEFRLSASARYVGRSRLGIGPILGRSQGEYLDVGAEARAGGEERFLFLKASNLLDKAGNRFALGSILTIVDENQMTPLRPRTLKLGVQTAF